MTMMIEKSRRRETDELMLLYYCNVHGCTGALVNDYFSPKIKPISSRVQFTDVAKIYFLIVFDRFENF